jgi:hypothetical protein
MNRPILLCAVFAGGLLFGGAASWLILDQGAHAGPRTPERGQEVPVSDAPRREVPPAIDRAPESRAAELASMRPKAFDSSKDRVASDLGIETGTGTISGKVKNERGQPVAGVVVRASFQGDRRDRRPTWKKGDGPPPDDDLQGELQRFIEDSERNRAMRRSATTGENGEFTLDGLVDDRYSLQAFLSGFVVSPDQSELAWNAKPGVWVEFTASPVQVVKVDVRLADGTVPKKANLVVRVRNSSTSELWRPDTPELRLGVGAYAISATAGDREEWSAEPQNVTLKEGAPPAPLSFKLTARTGIRGRVRVPKGYALDSLSVFATRFAGTTPPDEQTLRGGQNSWASQWNGYEFSILDLAPGNWLVGAGTWESVFTTKVVEVKAGVLTDTILEITDAGASGLVVRVVAPDGSAAADVNLHVFADRFDASETFSVRPKTDGAWVVAAKKEGTEPKDCFLQAHSERYGSKTVPLPGVSGGELKIEFAEPASLDVTVTGYAGSNVEGRLKIDAKPIMAGRERHSRVYYSSSRDDQIGPDGKQTLRPLQPGRYRVELQYMQERWNSSVLDHVDVDVRAGANQVTIAAPAVYSLTVVAPGEPAGTHIGISQIGGSGSERWGRSPVGADGTSTFEGLSAGTYRLILYSKAMRQRSMKVTIPAAGSVTFKEDVETALVLKALDSDGFLASSGLQAGDVITGVDGTAFDGARPAAQVLLGLVSARKELKLQITRAGKALEVTVDSDKFAASTNHTRALEPAAR